MRLGVIAIIILVLGGLVSQSAYIVMETRQVLVFRFGEILRVATEPGLYFKLPFIEQTTEIEKRIIPFTQANKEVSLADQRNIRVAAFARYKITDPKLFYTRTGGGNATFADRLLSDRLNSALTTALAQFTLGEIIKDARVESLLDVTRAMRESSKELGVEVLDVRLQSVDLPADNRSAVYEQMKAERVQEAAEITAKGEEQAKTIRAEAQKQLGRIQGDAIQREQEILGKAGAERERILAQAHAKNPDFADLWQTLQGYQNVYKDGKGPPILITPDSFFRYLNDFKTPGTGGAASSQAN